MAKTVVALEASFDTNQAEGSVKSLKSQLKEAQAEVAAMADKFGDTSTQAAAAAKKAAELKDRIGDAKALTDAFSPDKKFQAFSQALQGVAGGFAAVQGAQALFGSESKDLEKTLVKVQGALALSQGLSAITEAKDSFKNLKTVAVDAFNSIKTAIGSSGIGLLVVALGAIYANWDKIKGAVSGVSAEQKKLNESTDKNLKLQKEKLDAVSSQDNILKLQGKSEKDILKIKVNQTNQVIAASEAQIKNNIETTKAQVEAAKRNQAILKGVLEFLTAPLALVLKTVDMVGKALGKDFGLESGFYGTISKLVFDPAKIQEDADASLKEQQKALNELKNTQAGYQLALKEIDKKAAADKKQTTEQSKKEVKDVEKKSNEEQLETERLLQEARLAQIKDAYTKQQQVIENNRQSEIDKALEDFNNKLISEEEFNIRKDAINQKYDAQRSEAQKTNDEKLLADKKKKAEDEIKIEQEKAAQKQAIQDAEFGALDAGVNFLKAIAGKNKALQKAAIIAENAMGIAKIITNTMAANAKALSYGPAAPSIIAANNISAGFGVASTLAATAKALKAINSGGDTSAPQIGGGGGTTAPIAPQMSSTSLNQAAINNLGNQAIKTYVLSTDVSGNQERIDRIQRAARIGP